MSSSSNIGSKPPGSPSKSPAPDSPSDRGVHPGVTSQPSTPQAPAPERPETQIPENFKPKRLFSESPFLPEKRARFNPEVKLQTTSPRTIFTDSSDFKRPRAQKRPVFTPFEPESAPAPAPAVPAKTALYLQTARDLVQIYFDRIPKEESSELLKFGTPHRSRFDEINALATQYVSVPLAAGESVKRVLAHVRHKSRSLPPEQAAALQAFADLYIQEVEASGHCRDARRNAQQLLANKRAAVEALDKGLLDDIKRIRGIAPEIAYEATYNEGLRWLFLNMWDRKPLSCGVMEIAFLPDEVQKLHIKNATVGIINALREVLLPAAQGCTKDEIIEDLRAAHREGDPQLIPLLHFVDGYFTKRETVPKLLPMIAEYWGMG